ncbi:MAG: TauD/TfdA dioxygenase family protein [Pseudomonadales bacterium]
MNTTTNLKITPTDEACGAWVSGVDLTTQLDSKTITAIRTAWLEHKVLAFPNQQMTDTDLENFALNFGDYGEDPFFESIPGHEHIAEISRLADEQAPVFAETWHSDWSFQPSPPIATCLYGITIPSVGGNTGFVNQELALAKMPPELRKKIEGRVGIHSAENAYAPDGFYGENEKDSDRSMKIRASDEAYKRHSHPLIRVHPETGRETLFSCLGYIIGIEDMPDEEARPLLQELLAWQTQEAFQYNHQWRQGMLVMWDNRCVLHKASGGYDGQDRILHRVTIAQRAAH